MADAEYAEVSEVEINTRLFLTKSLTKVHTNVRAYKQTLKPDFGEDAILAQVQKGNTGLYAFEAFVNARGRRGAGRWQIPVSTLPTNTAQAQVAWDSNWSDRPGSPVVGDQANFFEGTLSNFTGTAAWSYDGSIWINQAEIIDGDLIVTGSITTDKIFANAITADKIAANQINADQIAANSITANAITANSVVSTLIAASAVTATDISTTNIAAISANLGNITAGTLKNSGANAIPDANSAPSGNEIGGFIDLNQGRFVFGSASKHILWNGTDLTLSGVIVSGSLQLNVTDAGGLGSLTYSAANSQLTYTGPSNSDVRGLFSGATSGDSDLGQLTYDNTQGQYAFAGPTAATIRGKFSGGNGISYTSGTGAFAVSAGSGIAVSSGNVAVDNTVIRTTGGQSIAGTTTLTNVAISGDLTVSGSTTSINTTNLVIEDNKIVVNNAQTGTPASTVTAGIEVERGNSSNKSFVYAESGVGETGNTSSGWTFGSERVQAGTFFGTFIGDITGSPSSLAGLTTDNLAEGVSNLYFTDARARAAVSAGNGISYNSTSGAISVAAGNGLTVSGSGVDVSGVTTSMIASGSILVGNETFSDSDTQLMTAAAVNDRILSFNYTTNVGDITRVHAQAGQGLTGTQDTTSGDADFTFNVGQGTGITVAADSVAINTSVVPQLSASNSFTNSYNEFGNSTASVSNDGSWNARLNLAGSQHAKLDVKSVSDGIITTMYAHTGHNAARIGSTSNHKVEFMTNGNVKATLLTTGYLSTTAQGTLWGASNDGATSGLDADLLDGQHGSYYLDYNNFSNTPTIPTGANNTAITFQRNGTTINTVYLNQTNAETVNFTDTNTTYSAASGGGLSLNGTEFSLASTATGGTVVVDLLSANQIQANHIAANSITARELAISNGSSGSAGIYFSTTAMEIHDGTRVRVKIGAL